VDPASQFRRLQRLRHRGRGRPDAPLRCGAVRRPAESHTRQLRDRIIRIYEQTPDPKFVVAVGACAMSGCVYRGAYNICGGLDQVIPVNVYIPGCPVRPDAILDGVVKLINTL
jgi:Ni,Fe-hydrogenase III small subunit